MRVFVAGATGVVGQPLVLGRLLAGPMAVMLMTQARGASNGKAKRELGWAPQYASWRDGFPVWVKTAGQARAS